MQCCQFVDLPVLGPNFGKITKIKVGIQNHRFGDITRSGSTAEYKRQYFGYTHWRQSALNSAGALQGGAGNFGEFSPHFIL